MKMVVLVGRLGLLFGVEKEEVVFQPHNNNN